MAVTDNRFFVCLSMWNNMFQEYFNVGTLVYDFSQVNKTRLVGFLYNDEHLNLKLPAIDPANLNPDSNKFGGKFVSNDPAGKLPHYFASFLPGSFGDDLISGINKDWSRLTETEKLYVMTFSHGDFGAPRLNAYKHQNNRPIRDLDQLSQLVIAIREYQEGHLQNPLSPDIQGALCNMQSHKPMVDFEATENGIERRFVVKLNCTGFFNDAAISSLLSAVQNNAGATACDGRVVKLESGEDVLFSYNYSRTEEYHQDNDGVKKTILKYNRVSFKVLLAEDDYLDKNEPPSYKHIAHAIKLYSSDSQSDLFELYTRAFVSASTNHTSNGLSNMEMFDDGAGNWRLSPSFNNLPNPMTSTQFDCSFSDKPITSNLLNINTDFVHQLGESIGIDQEASEKLALAAGKAIQGIDKLSALHNLSDNDSMTLKEVVKFNQIEKLVAELEGRHKLDISTMDVEEIEEPSARGPKF